MIALPASLLNDVEGMWQPLKRFPPEQLEDARLQAHWAVQAVASVGASLVEARADHSHMSMSWLPGSGLLAGAIPGGGLGAGLRPRDLTLVVLDDDGITRETCSLDGRTLDGAIGWLAGSLERLTGEPLNGKLVRPDYPMPSHRTGDGGAFSLVDLGPFEELVRWYANAELIQRFIARHVEGASTVRCWPHHFDIATLISLDSDETEPSKARTIGVGLSPGDESYAEPYFYVTFSPAGTTKTYPPLSYGGLWHQREWTGAVLTAKSLAAPDSGGQPGQLIGFIQSALAATHSLMG